MDVCFAVKTLYFASADLIYNSNQLFRCKTPKSR